MTYKLYLDLHWEEPGMPNVNTGPDRVRAGDGSAIHPDT